MKISRKRLVQDLSTLVQIQSWQECQTITQHLLDQARREDLGESRIDEAGNVLLEFAGQEPALLLNAHVDTVPPGDYRGEPFSGKLIGGRIVGRGSSDDKAGVAALLEIARMLKVHRPRRKVIIGLSVWEESTSCGENGAWHLARTCGASQAIILESSMSESGKAMAIDIGCRGIQNLSVTVNGKSCHSARPQLGENAIYRAARVLEALEKAFQTEHLPERSYKIGSRTVTLGTLATVTQIEATQGVNVIPGVCRIDVNCRLLPDGGSEPGIQAAMESVVSEFPRGWVQWQVDNQIQGHICTDQQLIKTCRAGVAHVGLRSKLEILPARTDTTIYQNEGGIQSVVMGPGTMGTAHRDNEYVTVDNLAIGTEAVWHAVKELTA